MQDIVLVGFGGHAKSVADTIERQGLYRIVGYTDIAPADICPYPYLGTDTALPSIFEGGVHHAAVGIGYIGKGDIRDRMFATLKSIGYTLPVIADPTAVISPTATVGEGSFIGKYAVINAAATVGNMTIINTRATVEHDCRVGDFAHVSVGTVLCGTVTVGARTFVGAGAAVIQGIAIGANTVIGAGTVVAKPVADNIVLYNARQNIVTANNGKDTP